MKKLRIGVGLRFYNRALLSGVWRWGNLLLRLLKKNKTRHKFTIFSEEMINTGDPAIRMVRVKIPGCDKRTSINQLIAWEQFFLPDALEKERIQVFHSLAWPIPVSPVKGCKFIITVHDILPWLGLDADTFTKPFNVYFKKWIAISVKKADKVHVISNQVKKEVMEQFGVRGDKIKVIYNCVDPNFRPLAYKDRLRAIVKKELGIEGEFILNVNLLSPRKNVETLIKAYALLKRNKKIKQKLVITGSAAFYKPHSIRSKDIIFTGAVSQKMLLYLYNLADVFVFPSIYEGFGYPPLEAMACGTPVIVSDNVSLREIAGPAACTFDPKNAYDLSEKILELLENEALRESLITKGFSRTKCFSYKRHADELLKLYESLA